MTFTSSSALFVVVIVFAVFALTAGKDAVKNVDLAKQLEEAKQESAKLRQQLEKSNEEVKNIITRENKKLRSEDSKLKREADKVKAEAEELRKENEKLRRQDEELRQRDAVLERKVNELRHDNSEVKKAFRQRDQNNTLELQNVVRNSFGFRQMDFTSELKKMMNQQIKEYLNDNKMCVMGQICESFGGSGTESKNPKIEFGQTFQRIPAFAAALSNVNLKTSNNGHSYVGVNDFHVTNSSAVVQIYGGDSYYMCVNWVACL